MTKTSIIILFSVLLFGLLLYIFIESHYTASELEQINDVETDIRKINKIVDEIDVTLELIRVDKKNLQYMERWKSNLDRLTNDYIYLKKVTEKQINYLRDSGIDYKFTKIKPIDN